MKGLIQRLTRKQILFGITGVISLLCGLILMTVSHHMTAGLDTQHMAERWSEKGGVAQISCFFSREASVGEEKIVSFEHQLDSALIAASIVSESENPGARLWADAYSATGKITLQNNKTSIDVSAVGIGGDFFLFHPLKLITGAYFSGNDVLKDYVVIDEDAAWQLFGSNDVAGRMITIKGVPHIITGVVERPSGRLEKEAGLTGSIAYVSYSTLEKYGINYGLNSYEIVMPNPVSSYAKNYVAENIGADEQEVEIVENTTRYSFLSKLKLMTGLGTRSMSKKAIIYPYWENIARGYEDILSLLLVFTILFFLYPAVLVIKAAVTAWKHKKWTVKSLMGKLSDKVQKLREKHWEKQKQRKVQKAEKAENTDKISKSDRKKKSKKEREKSYEEA